VTLPWTELEACGALASVDVELALALGRIAGETNESALLAVALTQRALREGHACLELASWGGAPLTGPAGGDAPCHVPARDALLDALAASPLVRAAPPWQLAPLVLEGDRLYLARVHDHECAVARSLRALAARSLPSPEADPALVDQLFAPAAEPPDLQRSAALAARTRALSVIVGGPGTGKTSTVVKLLALLVRDALVLGAGAPRILLLAPTGKAAQRLSEAIGRARDALPVDEAIRAAIPADAQTLHRALGPVPDGSPRFRHGEALPLDADIVLVDEASMIDLALMRHLLAAIPASARVILLGDADQLASVEAGSVLDDMCRADVPASPLAGVVSRLTKSYRYPASSGIARLARAIHGGHYDALCALRDARLADVTISHEPHGGRAPRGLVRLCADAYAGLNRPKPDDRLQTLDRFRVLAAHRRGPGSTEQLNQILARTVFGTRAVPAGDYAGRPVMISVNDYTTQLFNGDVGVLHRDRDGALRAYFRRDDGTLRTVAHARLPEHDSVFAMTIHKSQGSEFDHVAVVLPEEPSPMLSRELLYTAVTRAKKRVTLYASERALRACLAQRPARASGLRERLIAPEVEGRLA
jgi:exodeoxyribonuclease V alpha subunit